MNKYAFFGKWTEEQIEDSCLVLILAKDAEWKIAAVVLLKLVFRKLLEYLYDPTEVQLLLSSISWDLCGFFFSVKSRL